MKTFAQSRKEDDRELLVIAPIDDGEGIGSMTKLILHTLRTFEKIPNNNLLLPTRRCVDAFLHSEYRFNANEEKNLQEALSWYFGK